MRFPIFGTSGNNAVSNSNPAYYMIPMGRSTVTQTSVEPQMIVPAAFNLSHFKIMLSSGVGPGTGCSWVFTVRKNGVDTDLKVTLSDAVQELADNTHVVHFEAGDLLSFKVEPVGAAALTTFRWSMLGDTDAGGQILGTCYHFGFNSTNGAYVALLSPTGGFGSSTESFASFYVTSPGTFKRLYAHYPAAPGGAVSWTNTLRKNGANTTLVATVTGAATDANDTTHSVHVDVGDRVTVSCLPSGGTPSNPASNEPSIGVLFVPDIPGDCIMSCTTAQTSNTVGNITSILDSGFFADDGTNAAAIIMFPPIMTVKNFSVFLDTAPGIGKSWAFTFGGGGPVVTVAGAASTCKNVTDSVVAQDFDIFDIGIAPTGTPAGNSSTDRQHFAYTVNMGQSGSFLELLGGS